MAAEDGAANEARWAVVVDVLFECECECEFSLSELTDSCSGSGELAVVLMVDGRV